MKEQTVINSVVSEWNLLLPLLIHHSHFADETFQMNLAFGNNHIKSKAESHSIYVGYLWFHIKLEKSPETVT